MKTRILSLILTLALLLTAFAGCGGETDSPGVSTDTPATMTADIPMNAPTDTPETELDYSWFEMPEETDMLTVYSYSLVDDSLRQASELFQALYPHVKVDYQSLGDAFDERVRAEIPAGRGPDILFGDSTILPDIYKTMSTGVLTDLAPYMANDGEYDPTDFYESIMKGGVMFGKQYLLPITQNPKTLLTTEELLRENGIEPDSLQTWEGFLKACTVFHENHPDSALFANVGDKYYINQLCQFSGFQLIDYDSDTVSFDETRFREMMDLCRLYNWPDPPKDLLFGNEMNDLRDQNCMFDSKASGSLFLAMNTCAGLRMNGLTPLQIMIPNAEDGFTSSIQYFAAIPEGTTNKLNAWRFLKVLLSDEMQYGPDKEPHTAYPAGANPVRRESLEKLARTYGSASLTEEDADNFIGLMNSVTDAIMLPQILKKYVNDYMTPYITSNDGANYDNQFEKLKNTLNLYKDE